MGLEKMKLNLFNSFKKDFEVYYVISFFGGVELVVWLYATLFHLLCFKSHKAKDASYGHTCFIYSVLGKHLTYFVLSNTVLFDFVPL